jgi:hypothetical protein
MGTIANLISKLEPIFTVVLIAPLVTGVVVALALSISPTQSSLSTWK